MSENRQKIVCKFGGGWFLQPAALNHIKNIVFSDKNRKIIVVSAPGKRFENDEKVTDLLFKADYSGGFDKNRNIFEEVERRFLALIKPYSTKFDIDRIKQKIAEVLFSCEGETLVSRGEFLTAKILAEFLDCTFVDATILIKIKNGKIDEQACADAAKKFCAYDRIVVPGFYGEDEFKKIRLLPRGGSDLTGAVLSVAFGAKTYENYTDTDGVRSADPRRFGGAKRIDKISYGTLSDFSFYGAKVLSAETCEYLSYSPIKTIVRRDEIGNGTTVTAEQGRSKISRKKSMLEKSLLAVLPAVKTVVKKYDGMTNEKFFSEVFGCVESVGVKVLCSRTKNGKANLIFSAESLKKIFLLCERLKTEGFAVYPSERIKLFTMICNEKKALRFLSASGGIISDFSFDGETLFFLVDNKQEKTVFEKFSKFEQSEKRPKEKNEN